MVFLYDETGVIGMEYALNGSGGIYYFRRNPQGDVVGIYDVNGNFVARYIYDAWGNCTVAAGTVPNAASIANANLCIFCLATKEEKTMKRCILLVMIATCMLVGCVSNTIRHWEFTYSFDYVKEIKLVDVEDFDRAYTVIKEIDVELAEELYTDISALEMKRNGAVYHAHGICFLVIFQSGECDLISQMGSLNYKFDQGELRAHGGTLKCDKEEFQKLIEKYM